VHFQGIRKGQGANMALPIWALYMKKAYKDSTLNISKRDFETPRGMHAKIDCTQSIKKEQENNSEEEEEEFF
jgi:penicillin-binding protein 1A